MIARTSQKWHGVGCLLLLAAIEPACGGGGTGGTPGSGGGPGCAGTGGGAGSVGTPGTGGVAGDAGSTGAAGTAGAAGIAGSVGSVGSGGTSGGGAGGGAGATAGRGGNAAGGRGGATGTAGAVGTAGAAGGRGGNAGSAGSAGTTGSAGASGSGGASMPSAGCSSTGGAPASGHYTIDASGTMREYIIKLPSSYDAHHPYRLIFAFHGMMYDAASVDSGGAPSKEGPYYGIEPMAGGGAIFVAAQALSTSWLNANDIPYVNAMIARFEAQLCIDESRIFATGFSMGAIQTIALGCAEGDVFRAIAPMSGEVMGTCAGTHRIAYWGSHGTSDPTIKIANGRAARDTFRTIDHCTTQTVAGAPSGCVNYQGCDTGYPVSWCEFDGVHEPPPFSGEAIWAFLSQF
jgi:poly(3-hydroxybutyrate) depolymerase